MVIFLDQYRLGSRRHTGQALRTGTDGGHIMALSVTQNTAGMTPAAVTALPQDLNAADVEAVLDQAYALATLI